MSIAPKAAEFIFGTPVNFDLKLDAGDRTASGKVNNDDLIKAAGNKLAQDKKELAAKQGGRIDAKGNKIDNKRISAVADPKAYHEQMLSRYARGRVQNVRGGQAAQLRVKAVEAKHTPSIRVSIADAQKEIKTQTAIPQNKTVAVNQQMLRARRPTMNYETLRKAATLALTIADPVTALIAAVASPSSPKPQIAMNPAFARRQNGAQYRAQLTPKVQAAAAPSAPKPAHVAPFRPELFKQVATQGAPAVGLTATRPQQQPMGRSRRRPLELVA